MAIQTRGQITLIATPDYRLQVSPQVITIPVNEDDSLLGGGSFSQEITINALDSLNNNLKFESVVFKNEKLTSNDGGYNWKYNWVPDLKNLANSGQLVFDVKLENNSDSAEDDYDDTVEVGWVKVKSGRDGTPAYGVNLWAKDQIFIKKLDENGVYIFEPNKIILTTTPINYEDLEGVSYKWFKDENENPIQTGGTTYEVKGNDAASGMYRVEVYNSEGTPIASDILGLGVATSGSEAFTVLLTNDSETVSTDRDKLSINSGTVSTGILVYQGANQLTPDEYSVSLETEGDENDSDPGEEIINNISFSYENGLITGSYDAYKAIDTRLKIVITVGQAEFIKYFYVKSSLAGESAKMIKVTGPQFFTVLANGDIYPESIELIANPQNVKFEKWTYFEDNSEIDIEDSDKYLTIEKNSSFWGDKKILRIRAYSENEEYYDEYPIYKIDDGKNSYSIIPSNETINIITDIFGLPVENKRSYLISFKVFSGNEEASYSIEEEITISPSNMSSFVSVEKENSSTFKIVVERNEETSYEFLTTQIDFTFKITGIDNSITKSIYLQPAQQGADAKRMSLSGPQVFRYNNATDGTINYNPTSTTISCLSNVYYKWYYKIDNIDPVEIGTPNTSLEILPNLSGWDNDKILYIIAKECDKNGVLIDGGIFDEITLYKVRDGSDGSDSLFVYPLNPSVIFTEGEEGKLVRQTINCPIKAFVGNIDTEVSSLSVDGGFGQEKGYYSLSFTKNNIIITVENTLASALDSERSGTILCTAVLEDTKEQPHTFNFPINWSIVKGGIEGNGINEIINYYYASPSNNIDDILKVEESAWTKNAIPSNYNTTNKYLWNYEYIDYSKIDDKSSDPFIIGVYGEEGKSVIGFEEYFYANNSSDKSNVPFPPNGSTIENIWFSDINQTSYSETIPYLWVAERAILDDNKTYGEWVGPRLAGVWGKTGEEGKPATNSVVLLLYRRSANTLTDSDKPGTLYYTFSTGSLTGSFNSWSEEIPTGTNPCYVIQYKAVSSENDTVTIYGPSWSTPKIFVQNGIDISRKIKNTTVFYKSITAINGEFTTPSKPTSAAQTNGKWIISGWTTELPSIGAATGYQIWSCNLIIYDDNTYTITEPEINPGAYADSLANQIYNGNIGIQIVGDTITKAVLNDSEGLFIKNSSGFSLKADGSSLGFYYNDDLRIGMYDFPNPDGSITTGMLIKGGIYADRGVIGALNDNEGWIIKGKTSTTPAAIHTTGKDTLNTEGSGVYIGTDGISLENAIKMYAAPSNNDGTGDLFIVNNKDDGVVEKLFSISKSLKTNSNKENKEYEYSISFNADSINFSGFVLSQENGGTGTSTGFQSDAVGIFKRAFGQEVNPALAKDGDLQILYPTSSSKSTAAEIGIATNTNDARFFYHASHSDSSSSNKTRFGITRRYWNISGYSNESVSSKANGGQTDGKQDPCWCRVGTGTSDYSSNSNSAAVAVPINITMKNISSVNSINLKFDVNTKPLGSTNTSTFNTSCQVALYKSRGDGSALTSYNSSDLIASSTYSPANTSATNLVQTCSVSLTSSTKTITAGSYYVVFYSSTHHTLNWVNMHSLTSGDASSSVSISTSPVICIKALDSWIPVSGSSEGTSGIYSLSSKEIDTGMQIQLLKDGIMSSSVDIPLSSSGDLTLSFSNTNGLNLGDLTVGDKTTSLYAPYATTSTKGVVQVLNNQGLSISNGSIFLTANKTYIDNLSNYYYRNTYIYEGNIPSGSFNKGDICFVY